jgi:hypothetical protein
VFRGGHTRTLSLLSPKKASDGFSVHEDESDNLTSPASEYSAEHFARFGPITPSQLSKRASWAPRSAHQPASGMKQIAEDFKAGLWTFMEDIRQAAVGDEPITGQGTYMRGGDGKMRSTSTDRGSPSNFAGDQDTIRASTTNSRPCAQSAFEALKDTPTPGPRVADFGVLETDASSGTPSRPRRTISRSKTDVLKNSKRFSWTPLTVDSYDDQDWSSWDTPTMTKSPRWSGSTANGDIATIPEKRDENGIPV